MTPAPLIIGLGSPHGDDQAGWCVIQALHARGVSPDCARTARTPADVWDWCQQTSPLTICDACLAATLSGEIRRFTWPTDRLPITPGGTHTLSLAEVLSLGRELNTIPETVEIWTIAGSEFVPSSSPSAAVLKAAALLAEQLAGAFGCA